jgi:retron-type reverse transcriptase
MKRMGVLFDFLVDRNNLVHAAWRAALGKRDRAEVQSFFAHFEDEVSRMGEQLRAGDYCFSPYRCFPVRDTKKRTIHAPTFGDRVAHHAIIGATGKVFETGALVHSYACRRGKGQHAALRQAAVWTRRSDWYGKMDVAKFYDSVDHDILRRLLERRFRERRLLALFDRLLDSYEASPGKGLPIGALTSQYLGNFYLDEFDRRMKATGLAHRYLRYMDDVVVWGTPATLRILRAAAREILATLGLHLKHGGEWNRCERGIPFLGFVIYPDRLRLGRQGRRRLRRKTRQLERAWQNEEISEQELQARGTSLFAHALWGDDVAWRRVVVSRGRYESTEGETLEPRSRDPRRLLEQFRQELPVGDPQQEEARQPQQEPGLPCLSGSRHGDKEQQLKPPDDAPSRSHPHHGWDEPAGKTSAGIEIPCGRCPSESGEKMSAEAPLGSDGEVA